jgi:hypothetical protein
MERYKGYSDLLDVTSVTIVTCYSAFIIAKKAAVFLSFPTVAIHLCNVANPLAMISRKELCVLYNCGDKTIRKWLRAAGINHSKKILPHEYEYFKLFIGAPIKSQDRKL